ncbi:MAG: chemotaxis protein [Phyllobacteriaceae bacterium]|nr:chemotaxis protein [Phyllobacteriaceae bacterium]
MTTTWIDLAVEGLVAVLLATTIGYCILLDKRLKRLRADEANLRATISELLTATEIAERAIVGLKDTAADADKTLAQRLREAEFFSQEIGREIGEGEKLLNRIIRITEAARAVPEPTPVVAPVARTAEATVADHAARLGDLRARAEEANRRIGQMKARSVAA